MTTLQNDLSADANQQHDSAAGNTETGHGHTVQSYHIQVDRQNYEVQAPQMTGRQILELAGKRPTEQWALYEKLQGGATKKIGLDDLADFRDPGLERFMTLPLDQTEGEIAPQQESVQLRRQFSLPEEDEQFLSALGLPWETVLENGLRRVLIHNYDIPDGYNVTRASVSVLLPTGYPETQIDMAYFHPRLALSSGRHINNLSDASFVGKTWQQWSRHRTAANPWRPGIDNLASHMAMVGEWLIRELKKE